MNEAKHTPEQLRQFMAYERVRARGRFNMFDPRARQATGLDSEAYVYVMKNYATLRDAAAAISKATGSAS